MNLIFKTSDKAAADAWQRQQRWNMTPQERLHNALKLREFARALRLANPANAPLPAPPDGKTIFKSDRPIERGQR